jgi:hypothetical protein
MLTVRLNSWERERGKDGGTGRERAGQMIEKEGKIRLFKKNSTLSINGFTNDK